MNIPPYALLLVAGTLCATQADRALTPLMGAGDLQVQILRRVPVDTELDLVVALGMPRKWEIWGEGGWWGESTRLGLFLQRRENPGLVYRLALEDGQGDGDCYARVERATATDVVLSCMPEKGDRTSKIRFIYSIRSKSIGSRTKYDTFVLDRIAVADGRAVLTGSDTQHAVIVEYDPARDPAFRVRKGVQRAPASLKPPRFGPGKRFTLSKEAEGFVVEDRVGNRTKRYPLIQSKAQNSEATQMNEVIGPWQIVDGTLWFAKTFYDGEGMTGTGGFGYFDINDRKYRIFSPPEIAKWSATSMLVEPDAVWIGLAHHGEWRSSSGGLLRYDRSTKESEILKLPDIASQIARVGDRLLIATRFGAAVLEEGALQRFFVDEAADGRVRILASGLQ
jgi:hypothetical protein